MTAPSARSESMSPHLSNESSHKARKSHLALGVILLGAALVLGVGPALRWVAATVVAFPVGVAIAVHLLVVLAGSGAVIAALRSRGRRDRGHRAEQGVTLHSARLYDWMALGYTFGREGHLRERTLDAAGITAGEQVLDVGCGTGTLTLAARKRVGASGSVRGVDASPEMIARARS